MERGLVVIGGTESSNRLLREAAEHASGAGADLVVLSLYTEEGYEHDVEVLNRIAEVERASLPDAGGDEFAKDVGERIVRDALADYEVAYQVVGSLVSRRIGRRIIDAATNHDCDHIFLLSKPRSRFSGAVGKAIETVLERWDDPVTIARQRERPQKVARIRMSSYDDWEIEPVVKSSGA